MIGGPKPVDRAACHNYALAVAVRTQGRALLVKWMRADKSRTQGFVARTLSVTQPAVRAWVRGESRPVEAYREALRRLAGIPPEAWETRQERERRAKALAGVDSIGVGSPGSPDSPRGAA